MKRIFQRFIALFIALMSGIFILRRLYSYPFKLAFIGLIIITAKYYFEKHIIFMPTLIPSAIIGLILLSNFILEQFINNDEDS